MASSPDPPDMRDMFENDYERQWVLKRSAQVAGCLIHDHMDKDDRERVARLAGDVGRKLRDFLVKRPDCGFLYQACLHGDLSQVGLATLLAFRSQFRSAAEIPADLNIYFDRNAPLGCHEFDEYLSKRFARWEENEDAAVGFQEPTAVEHTYWGRYFTEKMRPGAVVDETMFEDYKGLDARDYFDANKPVTRGDVLKFFYDCRVYHRERCIRNLEDFAEGRMKFSKEILFTDSGFPIISEQDQINIVCAFCDDSLPISSLDQLRSHCRKRGHTFATVLSILRRQGEVLRLRHRDQAAASSSKATGLCSCPACGQDAETWDAIEWHFSRIHKGKLEESLHGVHLMQYLVWAGLRAPPGLQMRKLDRQMEANIEYFDSLCPEAA